MTLSLRPTTETLRLTAAGRAPAPPPRPQPEPQPVLLASEKGEILVTDQGHALLVEAE